MISHYFRITGSISVDAFRKLLEFVAPKITEIVERKVYNARNEVNSELANNKYSIGSL